MKKETLCWSCTRPGTNFCSWDRSLVPVKDWVAVPTQVDEFQSYRVLYCPLYQKEQPHRLVKEPREKAQTLRRVNMADGTVKFCLRLTDELLMEYDQLGFTVEEIVEKTGASEVEIYSRRKKLRRCERELYEGKKSNDQENGDRAHRPV